MRNVEAGCELYIALMRCSDFNKSSLYRKLYELVQGFKPSYFHSAFGLSRKVEFEEIQDMWIRIAWRQSCT